MNTKIKVFLLVVVIAAIVSSAVYLFFPFRNPRYSPERYQKIVKMAQSLMIQNDSGHTVIAEFVKDNQPISEEVEDNSIIHYTQGRVSIFVLKDKGWYTIEYPYPYPLSETFFGPALVVAQLSRLINSIQSGEVTLSDSRGKETTVKDIKVTFEPEK